MDFRVIVGTHVGETSVLARAALVHLLAQDVSQPPLMFGPRGLLDTRAYGLSDRPGLGLTINEPA